MKESWRKFFYEASILIILAALTVCLLDAFDVVTVETPNAFWTFASIFMGGFAFLTFCYGMFLKHPVYMLACVVITILLFIYCAITLFAFQWWLIVLLSVVYAVLMLIIFKYIQGNDDPDVADNEKDDYKTYYERKAAKAEEAVKEEKAQKRFNFWHPFKAKKAKKVDEEKVTVKSFAPEDEKKK